MPAPTARRTWVRRPSGWPRSGSDTYDPKGARTKATTGSTVVTYGYDQESRLTGYGKTGATATYAYDGNGQRTAKTVNGPTTRYTWSSSGDLLWDGTTAYLYGPAGLPVEQIGPATQWFLADQLGSTRALVDTTGAVVGAYGYTPWGAVSSHTGTASTSLQYTGQYGDAESGLLYLRARYYDPTTVQFLTVDPIYDSTGDRYGYVGDNPLNATDLTGLCWSWASAACTAARYAVDVVAVVPYTVYYGSYYTAKGINAVGDQFGAPGRVISHLVAAPLVLPQVVGLGLDIDIDWAKNATGIAQESVWDEGKRGYIDPLHGISPGPLKGPQVYLPGCHSDRSGIDFQW